MTLHPVIVSISITTNDTTVEAHKTIAYLPGGFDPKNAAAIAKGICAVVWTAMKIANPSARVRTRWNWGPAITVTVNS